MAKTKKELIIESFQNMDENMLEVLLDERKTYQDATKETFLEKMSEVFSTFRENGDNNLLPYKGICNQKDSNDCPNKGCTGYTFVGNTTQKHIDLIFSESGNDISDIYHCSAFETIDKSVERKEEIWFLIHHNEKANFNPDVEYWILSQNCNIAFDELTQYHNTIIDSGIYLPWLEKHHELYHSFEFPPVLDTNFEKFWRLYNRINRLKEYLESRSEAKEMVERFPSINKNIELHLLKFLTRYETTYENLSLFGYHRIDYEYPENTEYFEVDVLKISMDEFIFIAKFKFLFDEIYEDMLYKYTTFSDKEQMTYFNEHGEMSKLISSLSYHLKQRGIVV